MPGKIFLSTPGGGTSYAYTPADVAGSTGPLTVLGGTLTGASTPFLNLSQTWNNAATTFTGALVNVTDTASNSASLLQDWQVGGVSKASIKKDGTLTVAGQINVSGGSSFLNGSTLRIANSNGDITLSGAYLTIATTSSWAIGGDTILSRDAANVFAQKNSTIAQSFRVYNTFTDASNYERGVFDWTTAANILTIGTAAAGTGTQRNVNYEAAQHQFNIAGVNTFQIASATINTSATGFIATNAAGITIRASNASAGINFNTGGANSRWQILAAGTFQPMVDNTFDFGSSSFTIKQIWLSKTITAAGTTGAQTINKSIGSVNFAAAATSLVVTDSYVTTSSVIVATVGTNDTTMKTVSVVAAAGSFTLTANAAATAETRVNFVVLS